MAGGNESKQRRLAVDTDEAAEMIGVSPRTLMNWRGSGCGPPFLKLGPGGRTSVVRYRVAALEDYLRRQERRSTSYKSKSLQPEAPPR